MKWLLCFLMGISSLVAGQFNPLAVYLTWVEDPTTSMVICWHAPLEESAPYLIYEGRKIGAVTKEIRETFQMCRVDLRGLEPGKSYAFQIGEKKLSFETLPKTLNSSLRFVIGGDAYYYLGVFKQMNRQIVDLDPAFVVIGGDIAYTRSHNSFLKGKNWETKRWQTFFKEWGSLRNKKGHLIPLVPVVGNHDVAPANREALFYDLFPIGRGYRELLCGDYLGLSLLDTGHTDPIEGEQTEWLQESLKKQRGLPYRFAVYHVGAYPSVYKYEGKTPRKVRDNWGPLFEKYGVQLAFEHHSHAYKRTYPLKRGKIDPSGVIYLGDGAWGVIPRKIKKHWYLEKVLSKNHVFSIELGEKGAIKAIGERGDLFDEVEIRKGGS